MLKSEAILRWGAEVVEEARDYYETDFGKYLFQEDCPDDEYCAREEDQIERCTRASRNLKLESVSYETMGKDGRYGVPFFERFSTRRSMTHEYVFSMPVAAYREKRQDISPEELEFLRGDPGYQYSEHWSTPNMKRAERLFSEFELRYMFETLISNLLCDREDVGQWDQPKTEVEQAKIDGIQLAINRLLDVCS